MLYLLAIFFPPLAILVCGKPIQVFFNVLLIYLGFFVGFFPCIIHAIIVVSNHLAERRFTRLSREGRFRLRREQYER
jgi:uncharacterized membrane protein YqaE (UPF0057 family)